jgi:hypothetical protein
MAARRARSTPRRAGRAARRHRERRAALRAQAFDVRFAAEQALVVGERDLDLAVLRQHRRHVGHAEALGGLALGDEEILHAVLGHDARGLLRQCAPQIVAAGRMSPGSHRQKIGSPVCWPSTLCIMPGSFCGR